MTPSPTPAHARLSRFERRLREASAFMYALRVYDDADSMSFNEAVAALCADLRELLGEEKGG